MILGAGLVELMLSFPFSGVPMLVGGGRCRDDSGRSVRPRSGKTSVPPASKKMVVSDPDHF